LLLIPFDPNKSSSPSSTLLSEPPSFSLLHLANLRIDGKMSVGTVMVAGAIGAFNPAVQVGIFIGTFVGIALSLKKQPDPNKQTTLSLIIGSGTSSDGSVPHIAVWDRDGNRIGQYKGDANGHWDANSTHTIVIDNDQNGYKAAQPEYLSVAMQENDMICLSAIYAQGDGVSWSWTGDMGYACDAQWYPSDFAIGSSNSAPRCVWLDHTDKKGAIASALSIHIRDFTTDQDLLQQYTDDQKRLCQNSARMTFHSAFAPDAIPAFFSPPLGYTRQGDSGTTSGGGLKNPDQGVDRHRRAYNDGAPALPPQRRRFARRRSMTGIAGVKNNMPGYLVVSEMDHSAQELCEHHASLGPDFVAVKEGFYCDMEAAKWWPLCKDEQSQGCFDLDIKVVRGYAAAANSTLHSLSFDPVPVKNYGSVNVWESKL
jgi:hypothetical protein